MDKTKVWDLFVEWVREVDGAWTKEKGNNLQICVPSNARKNFLNKLNNIEEKTMEEIEEELIDLCEDNEEMIEAIRDYFKKLRGEEDE